MGTDTRESLLGFSAGMLRRIWQWAPLLVLDVFDVWDRYVEPWLGLGMPGWLALGLWIGALMLAAFLTYHDLRVASANKAARLRDDLVVARERWNVGRLRDRRQQEEEARNQKKQAIALTLLVLLESEARDLAAGDQPTSEEGLQEWKRRLDAFGNMKDEFAKHLAKLIAPSQMARYASVQWEVSKSFVRKFNDEHNRLWHRICAERDMLQSLMKEIED